MPTDREFRVEITNEDIRRAKISWLMAWESDVPHARVCDLYTEYAQLISAQAQQIADDDRIARLAD